MIESGQDARRARGATADEHIGRYRELAEAGVQTAIVGLGDADGPESVARFAPVLEAFRQVTRRPWASRPASARRRR